jgi:Holliday junction resolvasome RuvABC endonuclease subunit
MILGLDISTSITGATVLDKSGNMLYNESWDTRNKNKFPTLYQKANFVKNNLTEIKHQFNIEKIVIEQSLQSFRSGFSSAKTLSTLSRFNGKSF